MSATTEDEFLGGRLRVLQPVKGYRAGIDPVLLAAAVPARPGDSVLELGTGVAVALLCLMTRVSGLAVTGIERHPELARLAVRNVQANGFDAAIIDADLAALPAPIRKTSYDHVIANPPFFDRSKGSASDDTSRESGRGLETPLADWVDAGVRRLKPGGRLSMIQRVDCLPELLGCRDPRVGDITVLPFAARIGRPAKLVVVQARKGARGPFRLLAPFILHSGPEHDGDRDDYLPETRAVLREGAALDVAKLMNS